MVWESKVFPKTVRDIWIYVPAQYSDKEPANLMVFQDGVRTYATRKGQFRVPTVFDNLIHKKEMPVTIAVFIDPGSNELEGKKGQPDFANRSFEYDTLSPQYAEFLEKEVIPEVEKKFKIRKDPQSRAICGISSGGICAFTVAWERPDLFGRVLSHVGSFTNIRGGDVYPGRIRKTPTKPIRVFLQGGSGDLDNEHGNWPLANQQMALALKFKDYDYRFEFGDGGHNGKHGGAILPDSLRWLFRDEKPFVVYEGKSGPGKGKHVVLVSGDEEYRSEEALPQLAKILAKHHGFKCTVLFAIDPVSGVINPNVNNNIPGLEALKEADLLIIATRFRDLPDEQMKSLADYIESGKPIIGIRTATHAFSFGKNRGFLKYHWNNKEGGFGRMVLGETWVSHHGNHGSQSTRGIIAPGEEKHPIVRDLKNGEIWGPTDVYGVHLPLPGDSKPLVLGQVLDGMKPTDMPLAGAKNEPMMPIAWTRTYTGESGKTARVFTTTMGASQDLLSEGTRRMLVNATFWTLGMEDAIRNSLDVDLVGDYRPSPFRFGGARKGVRPSELAMP
ncbi:MAG: ThuA domain-containing protein [Planctomycetes bacterium]|nr:ThuA domain-containing protein [Planctomycetota bacterium]